MATANMVGWAVGPDGYTVQVLDEDNQLVKEARFGNNPSSSDPGDSLSTDHPRALGHDTLVEYAVRTALDLAEEFGLAPEKVFHDQDWENALCEEYAEHQSALDALRL
jgi:hypothetical protein